LFGCWSASPSKNDLIHFRNGIEINSESHGDEGVVYIIFEGTVPFFVNGTFRLRSRIVYIIQTPLTNM